MEKRTKFVLPSPNFVSKLKESLKPQPHFLTPCGMTLLPREKQPPPMYGPRGPTLPAKYIQNQHNNNKVPETQQERQFCEPCEMDLQSPEDLRRHRAQHEHCPVDGCSYRGHASVMDKHVTTLHASGLFDTLKKFNTPEEIAAWREERRKKYPTVANVQIRQRAQEQRQKRGERLEANQSRFGKRKDRNRIQKGSSGEHGSHGKQRESGMQKGKRNEKKSNKRKIQAVKQKIKQNNVEMPNKLKEEKTKALVSENYEDIQCGGICIFQGTSTLKDYKRFKVKTEVKSNALVGLLGMYGSDEEDSDTVETEAYGSNENLVKEENDVAIESMPIIDQDESTKICTESQELIVALLTPSNKINIDILHHEVQTKEIILCDNNTNDIIEVDKFKVNVSENYIYNVAFSDESPEEAPIAHTSDFPMRTRLTKTNEIDIVVSKNETKKGGSNNYSKRTKNQDSPKSVRQCIKRKSGLDYRKLRLRKQNTILEKLLEPDIRHERNVLLQCVRYVCENNFFGIGQVKKQSKDLLNSKE